MKSRACFRRSPSPCPPLPDRSQAVCGAAPVNAAGAPTATSSGSASFTCAPPNCDADSYLHAQYGVTAAGQFALGTCDDGWSGNPTRACEHVDTAAVWASEVTADIGHVCEENTCDAEETLTASWAQATQGSEATGTCKVHLWDRNEGWE